MASSSSTKNPETNMSFLLTPLMVLKLLQSVEALCDPEFNPQGVAMLDVDDYGFEITVRNAVTDVVGYLYLDASWLLDFHCNKPIVRKMISLKLLHEIILIKEADAKMARMAVFQLDESTTNLSFKFGKYPGRELAIEFLDVNAEFDKFPEVPEYCCEIFLENTVLMEMIKGVEETPGLQSLQVSIQVSEKQLDILAERPTGPYRYLINGDDKKFEARVYLVLGMEYIALFELLHVESMKKAASLGSQFYLRILTKPFGNIMIQFNIGKAGRLVFIQKCSLEQKEP